MNRQEIIQNLEIMKAEVEWEYPLDYTITIDNAIKMLQDDKNCIEDAYKYGIWESKLNYQAELLREIDYILNCGMGKRKSLERFRKILEKSNTYEKN